MKPVHLYFKNFWPGFDPRSNNFLALLERRFKVEVEDEPDRASVVFESYFKKPGQAAAAGAPAGSPGTDREQVQIFFSGEPRNLPVGRHHAVISMNLLDAPNHFRYPQWMLDFQLMDDSDNVDRKRFGKNVTFDMVQRELPSAPRPGFACAVFNNRSHFRFEAARQLSAFGPVDLFGGGVGKPIGAKDELLSGYRINLCCENTIQPGYVTEKALEARAAGCVPLWWGDPTYRVDFHERAIVNLYEYDLNVREAFESVDLKELASTPLLKRHPDELNAELEAFLHRVITSPPARLFLDFEPAPAQSSILQPS
jgi:hypothetical protein